MRPMQTPNGCTIFAKLLFTAILSYNVLYEATGRHISPVPLALLYKP